MSPRDLNRTNKRSFSCHKNGNISDSDHENFEKSLKSANFDESELKSYET